MKTIKDMAPEGRGCNLPADFIDKVIEWQKANTNKVKTQ